jgi:aminomethyltransferase
MPLPTPLHKRTSQLCETQEWREWAGYFSAVSYQHSHEIEYYAIRNSAGLLDVSPLFKYEIEGRDALRLVNRIMTRDLRKCKVGQMMYSAWCDEDGKVIDDGTIARLSENHFRLTAADPSLRWFQDCGIGMDVQVRDVSAELAALALQGPNARAILKGVLGENGLDKLAYYHLLEAKFKGFPLTITRTGYTGDLGYELWISAEHALNLWDHLTSVGAGYGLLPVGLAALDMTRVEAGLLLIDVDYTSTRHALIPSQESTPYELGLGWAVELDQPDFIGQEALIKEKGNGSERKFVGLEVAWGELDNLFAEVDLPPQVAGRASRNPVPLYANGKHIGQATSMLFSPLLKKYVALATVESEFAKNGQKVDMEITVEYERKRASSIVVKLPFYNPQQKKSLVNG